MLLAIDPGTCTGWAGYENGRLMGCGVGEDLHAQRLATTIAERVVIESPKLRPWGEKNPNAILTLARNAGEWGGKISQACGALVEYVTPNDWKGSTSKDVAHARIWSALSDEEKALVDRSFAAAKGRNGLAPSKRHNVLDAIGLGLWAVGRFGRYVQGAS